MRLSLGKELRGPTISDKLPSTELNQFRVLHTEPEGLSKLDKNAEKDEAIIPMPNAFCPQQHRIVQVHARRSAIPQWRFSGVENDRNRSSGPTGSNP